MTRQSHFTHRALVGSSVSEIEFRFVRQLYLQTCAEIRKCMGRGEEEWIGRRRVRQVGATTINCKSLRRHRLVPRFCSISVWAVGPPGQKCE